MKKLFFMIAAMTCCMAEDQFELLISPEEIAEKVHNVASQIDRDYAGEELTVLMVMKGAVCLSSDLIRNIHIPVTLEYVKASSYGLNGTKRGELKIQGIENLDFENKNVLVVDDIFDTGHTMAGLMKEFAKKNPKSLKSLVLLVKNIERKIDYRPDYSLFQIDDHFVVGYGLDYNELYRGLPGIYSIVQHE